MSLTRVWTRMGLFAALLGLIAVSLFGSLVVADRALSQADRDAVVRDVASTARLAERDLRLLADSLVLYAMATSGVGGVPALQPPPAAFDAIWMVRDRGPLVPLAPDTAAALDSATVRGLAAAVATTSPIVRVVPAGPSAQRLMVLVVPVLRGAERTGTAVGLFHASRLLAGLRDSAAQRTSVALRSGGQEVASQGAEQLAHQRVVRARHAISFPGDALDLEIRHAGSGRAVRTALWLLALAASLALLYGIWRERRQTIALATRTAELERLYQEVARSNRMKSEFLANVSHELRTPLNAVVGFVEMLREGVYGDLTPRQALPVDRIAASATHLRHLVDRLLDIAKIAAGRLEVHPEPLILRPFVLNVASEMESLVSERGLALSIGVGPTLPRIRTDQTHLRQILINLIGNAVKYTASGGIHVRAAVVGPESASAAVADTAPPGPPPDAQRSWVALQVADTGIGIAPADTERIFDEFEQVNAGARTDSERRGTGLGLAISRRLARLIGGELTVTSEVGKGSVFTVWLPIDRDGAATG